MDDRYDGNSPSGAGFYGNDRTDEEDSNASSGSGDDQRRNRRKRHREGRRRRDGGDGAHLGNSVWPKPVRLLSFAVRDDLEMGYSAVSMVQLDADGEIVDFANLPGLLYSSRSTREDYRKQRVRSGVSCNLIHVSSISNSHLYHRKRTYGGFRNTSNAVSLKR